MERRRPQAADFDGCGQMTSLSDIEPSGKMAFPGLIPLNPPAYPTPSRRLSGLSKSARTAHDLQEIQPGVGPIEGVVDEATFRRSSWPWHVLRIQDDERGAENGS